MSTSSATAAPFFVVGCPRSGTTLVQQLLSRHPDLAVTPETHFLQRFVHGAALGRDLHDPQQWSSLLAEVQATPEFAESGVDPGRFVALCEAGPRGPRSVFDAWLTAFATDRGAARVGEKTPNHLFDVDLLRDWFPGARFVVVLRDPRPVALSTGKVWWTAGSARGDARAWRRYETALGVAERDPRAAHDLRVLRYEDLVVDPQEQVDRVFDLLGVEPVDVEADRDRTVAAVDVEREHWKRNAGAAVDPGAADAWRSSMPAADVRAVEEVNRHGMARRGYLPTHRRHELAAGGLAEDVLTFARRTHLAATRRLARYR